MEIVLSTLLAGAISFGAWGVGVRLMYKYL